MDSYRRRLSIGQLPRTLEDDTKVKVAGVDVDGMLRGKIMAKDKFLSIAKEGFGFCSIIFGWDMHDKTYSRELKVCNSENGARDLLAVPDLRSFRRIPWEENIPFFLLNWHDPDTGEPLSCCPRGLLRTVVARLESRGMNANAGAEFEFSNFRAPRTDSDKPNIAGFLRENPPSALPALTEGRFGYSLTRPTENQIYFHDIFDKCNQFDCGIEGWHTESGVGVFEAALSFDRISDMADKANLFKYAVKSVATQFGITPCFMAKPREGEPGNAGHIHISIVTRNSENLFYREDRDDEAEWEDIAYLSDLGRHFLAGVIEGLPDIMPMLAPTINSYKRLVENFFAPVTVSWGLEHRASSIRLITPPESPGASRIEVRVPGADANSFYVYAAVLAIGFRGIEKKLPLTLPPLGKNQITGGVRLAQSLKEATEMFSRPQSIAREVFGDEFVEHYAGTRQHEIQLWDQAVTDWETRRYIETV
ncbi:putative glutamine synthetase [Pestalotiopsis sp. NC0098]|nr:putative glutamine synthetase [Pestalotiopsis sp. NC0098]